MHRIIKRCGHIVLCAALISGLWTFYGCSDGKSAKGEVRIPRLRPTFGYKDKEPMGAFLAYHYVSNLFDNGISSVTDIPISRQWIHQYQDNSLYILLAGRVSLSRQDIQVLLDYASRGNHVFISANAIDRRLLDTLGIAMYTDYRHLIKWDEYKMEKKNTWVSIHENPSGNNRKYWYYYIPFKNQFITDDTTGVSVFGYNEDGAFNFIGKRFGRGSFLFHAAPAAFSNYFLLKPGNHEYLEKVFAWLDPGIENIYWDNYYRVHNNAGGFSLFGFFKRSPPLYTALLLLLALLLIYLAFGSKRRQRMIPVRAPVVNHTVSYTETIGRLYLNKKDNRNIGLKMITYFLEFIRNHYYLNTGLMNHEFAELLAAKSGVRTERIKELLVMMDEVQMADQISEQKLMDLHNRIQECIKK